MTPEVRNILVRVLDLELSLLPSLKGNQEAIVRTLIWAAHDVLHPSQGKKGSVKMLEGEDS